MTPWLRDVISDSRLTFAEDRRAMAARSYLRGRGIDPDVAIAAGVGWLPEEYTVTDGSEDFRVWGARYLPGRLVFPFSTSDGKYTGMQTRSLSAEAAGKDRYQSYLLPGLKGVESPIFGAEHAGPILHGRQRWQVVLVEGPIDALAVRAAGEPAVIACVTGTPPIGTRQWCRRWAGSVLALLDMDAAGRRGVDVLAAEPGLLVSAPAYGLDPGNTPPIKDPAELWRRNPDALRALVAPPSADDLMSYLRGLL